jgi:hypothetical protein
VVSPSADKNVYKYFLEKTIPGKTDKKNVCLFPENNRIITINQPLTLQNSADITSMIATAIDEISKLNGLQDNLYR